MTLKTKLLQCINEDEVNLLFNFHRFQQLASEVDVHLEISAFVVHRNVIAVLIVYKLVYNTTQVLV